MRMSRTGAALLEVLVAMLLVAVVGLGSIGAAREATSIVGMSSRVETEHRAASDFLDAVSLWTRAELDQRLGARPQGPWTLEIQRVAPHLYQVALLDSAGAPLLTTALFRRERSADAP